MNKPSRFKEKQNNTSDEFTYLVNLEKYFENSIGSHVEKLQNFPKYIPRQDLTNFLAKYELFKKILHVPGSIVECGVLFGGGLMSFAQLSAIFEHTNFERQIIGFDTFHGISTVVEHDMTSTTTGEHMKKGGFSINSYDDILKSIELYDSNRFLNHIPKVQLVKGDAVDTIPNYLEQNPATVVSLLYLDFVAYEPTKIALDHFLPRMPNGAIIAFNLLNDNRHYPGTTRALLDSIGISGLKLQKFDFTPYTQYAILNKN